jgi:hypothetical protein
MPCTLNSYSYLIIFLIYLFSLCYLFIYSYYAQLYALNRTSNCTPQANTRAAGVRRVVYMIVQHARREQDIPPQRQRRRSWGGRHASCGWSEGGSQLRDAAAATRRAATPPLPATDPEHSEPGGAGVRGRGALSGGSTRGARGAGAEPSGAKGCGFESFRELPIGLIQSALNLKTQKRREPNVLE